MYLCKIELQITEVIFKLYNTPAIEGDCEVSLRSSSQQLPFIYICQKQNTPAAKHTRT